MQIHNSIGPEGVVAGATVVVAGVVTVVVNKSSSQFLPLASLPLSQVTSVGVQSANNGFVQIFSTELNQKRLGQWPNVPILFRQRKKEPHLFGCLRNE